MSIPSHDEYYETCVGKGTQHIHVRLRQLLNPLNRYGFNELIVDRPDSANASSVAFDTFSDIASSQYCVQYCIQCISIYI
jgi:hypothetical protein